MSEEEGKVKVTSSEPKDPKKVEAGKRLGASSKQLRERKMRERIQTEDNKNKLVLLPVLGVVVAIIGVVFTIKSYFLQASKTSQTKKEAPAAEPPSPPKKPPRASTPITLDE